MNDKKYQAGHWLGMGLGAGLAIGLIVSVVAGLFVGNTTLWMGIGSSIGMVAGLSAGLLIENKKKFQIKEMTPSEKDRHKKVLTLTILSILMLLVVSIFHFLKKKAELGL